MQTWAIAITFGYAERRGESASGIVLKIYRRNLRLFVYFCCHRRLKGARGKCINQGYSNSIIVSCKSQAGSGNHWEGVSSIQHLARELMQIYGSLSCSSVSTMAIVTSDYASYLQSNQSVGGDPLLSVDDNLHPLFKPLAVVRMSFTALIACVTIFSNGLALSAVMITPRLRVKAYALTTSLTVTNLLLSIVMIEVVVRDVLGVVPCELKEYRQVTQPIKRWIHYAAYVHVSFIAVDRYIAVVHALHYENRVTPKVIRTLILAIWLTAGVLTLPGYLGYMWPDHESCIATKWPKYVVAVETLLYVVSCTIVVVVYARIWKTVMHSELKHQQQQPSLAATATSGTTSQSGRGNVVQHGIRMLWYNRQLIRKHRATRTTMVILSSFVSLFFPFILSGLLVMAGLAIAQPMKLVGLWMCYLEFAINGFIYAIVNRDFRDAFKRMLFCRFNSHLNNVAPA